MSELQRQNNQQKQRFRSPKFRHIEFEVPLNWRFFLLSCYGNCKSGSFAFVAPFRVCFCMCISNSFHFTALFFHTAAAVKRSCHEVLLSFSCSAVVCKSYLLLYCPAFEYPFIKMVTIRCRKKRKVAASLLG